MSNVQAAYLIGIPLTIIGILCVFYARRLWKLWALFVFNNKINLFTIRGKDETIEEFKQKCFEVQQNKESGLFWVWVSRIMGALLALAGVVAIIMASFNI
jgi:hypothetical protein